MKKIIGFIIVSCFLIFNLNTKVIGSDLSAHKGINYFNFSNITILDGYFDVAKTIEPISLTPNVFYTLVVDFDFLGQHLDYIDFIYVEMAESDWSNDYQYNFEVDMVNELAYIEFVTLTGELEITWLPISGDAHYNIMIYQGLYDNFSHFEPYINQNESLIYEGLLPMDYDYIKSISEINSMIIAKNPNGTPIAHQIISDSFSNSNKLPGYYEIIYQTTFNQIKKYYKLSILILDLLPPSLLLIEPIEIPLSDKIDVNLLKNFIEITDNVDTLSNSDLVIVEDTYTTSSTVGTYHVKFRANDLSGNSSELTVLVSVIDKKAPIITGPTSIYLYTTDPALTNQQILSKYSAFDDVDLDNVEIVISQNLYNQTTLPGKHRVEISATDSNNNTRYYNIYIHVIDNRGPIFETTDQILVKSTSDLMSEQEIIDWFKEQLSTNLINATNIKVLYNEYDSNEKTIGSYYVYLSYTSNNETHQSRVRIDVIEDEINNSYLIISITIGVVLFGTTSFIVIKKKKH
jgi:hypothetical protein